MVILLSCDLLDPDLSVHIAIISSVLHNIMTCRVFRLLRLSQLEDPDDVTPASLMLDSLIFAIPQGDMGSIS